MTEARTNYVAVDVVAQNTHEARANYVAADAVIQNTHEARTNYLAVDAVIKAENLYSTAAKTNYLAVDAVITRLLYTYVDGASFWTVASYAPAELDVFVAVDGSASWTVTVANAEAVVGKLINGTSDWTISVANATVTSSTPLESGTTDPNNPAAQLGCVWRFNALAQLTLNPTVVAPPAAVTGINIDRLTLTMPAPTLNSKGRPVSWTPTQTRTAWGRLQVAVGGVDVTFYRDTPTQVKGWTINEPFSDASAEIVFPQVSGFETLPSFVTMPFTMPNVDLYLVRPDNSVKPLWEGLAASYEVNEKGLTLTCIGALYQLDFYRKAPSFRTETRDVQVVIAEEFTSRPAMRTGPPNYILGGGLFTRQRGGWQPVLTGYIQDLLTNAQDTYGPQLTLIKEPGRIPSMGRKDLTTVHWAASFGAPGVECELRRDRTTETNVYFGEGISDDNCHWRNTKYPGLRVDTAPVWPGTYICGSNNMGTNDRELWAAEAQRKGFPVTSDGACSADNQVWIRQLQASRGISVDGIVGPQTWAATFDTGTNGGTLDGVYFSPIIIEPTVDPYVYNADGSIITTNPTFDPTKPRIEQYAMYGQGVALTDAVQSAARQYDRDSVAGWSGTITLTADPADLRPGEGAGSRYEMRINENIRLDNFQGGNLLLHIVQVRVDINAGSTTLTVDTKARDLLTLVQIQQNQKDTIDPAKRPRTYRNSRQVEDRIHVFDCEAGGGRVPYQGLQAGLWNVNQIPFGEFGNVVRSEFTTSSPARFSVAVFDRPITHQYLRSRMTTPLEYDANGRNPWDTFDENLGLIMAWGGPDQAAGYYPGQESNEDDPLTGRLVDDASWSYETTYPGWLWVALWCEITTYISGRFYPGVEGYS